MGLDIHPKVSKKEYHYSYSALHYVRWFALVECGFPEQIGEESTLVTYPGFYVLPPGLTAKQLGAMVHAAVAAGNLYPNLLLHSDCEGSYTRGGKVKFPNLMTGNSVKLLAELEAIKKGTPDRLKTGRPWEVFETLYALVKDEVENGKGHIEFH